MGAGGAVGLDFVAVDLIMSRLGVADDERMNFYSKVRFINSVVVTEQLKEIKSSSKKK